MEIINFSQDELKLVTEGKKKVFRRVLDPQPYQDASLLWHWDGRQWMDSDLGFPLEDIAGYYPFDVGFHRYGADGVPCNDILQILDIRVERLQDITIEGILAEGVDADIPPICEQSMGDYRPTDQQVTSWSKLTLDQQNELLNKKARASTYADSLFYKFRSVWDAQYDRDEFKWDSNPFVWVVEFETAGYNNY